MESTQLKQGRVTSLDMLRGLVMVLMVLDHTRYFFHYTAVVDNPENLETTTPALFLTRWITHFCAPVFVFLIGISTNLLEQKVKSKRNVSKFLFTRGLFLIVLELTVLKIAWEFSFSLKEFNMLVIWTLGISMIFLAGIIHFDKKLLTAMGLLVIFGHNLLHGISFEKNSMADVVWKILYGPGSVEIGDVTFFFLFPALPYFGLVMVGYSMGYLYNASFSDVTRRRILIGIGLSCCALFIALRLINKYGDPNPWTIQNNLVYTILSFIKTTKYPTSLLYLLMTIGPSIIFLSLTEKIDSKISRVLVVFGKTPMYFYLWHLFIIHFCAIAIGGINVHNLQMVWFATLFVNFILYFLCKQYTHYKCLHPNWKWLRFI